MARTRPAPGGGSDTGGRAHDGRDFSRGVAATTLALRYRRLRGSMRGHLVTANLRVPLPHVAASRVVRRCRGTARRDVTALGVPRSATVLCSPRRQGNVNSIRRIDNDAVVRTCTDDGGGRLGRVVAACAPGEPIALG